MGTVVITENQEPLEGEDVAEIGLDVVSFIKAAANEAASQYGDDALKAGISTKVVIAYLGSKTLGFSVVMDIVLNDEPPTQAVLSQIAAYAAGAAGIALVSSIGAPFAVAALTGVIVSSFTDDLVDWLYQMRERLVDEGYPPLLPGAIDTTNCHSDEIRKKEKRGQAWTLDIDCPQ